MVCPCSVWLTTAVYSYIRSDRWELVNLPKISTAASNTWWNGDKKWIGYINDCSKIAADWRNDGCHRYSLNIWDVGGQKTIRSYWRNYFEQTDGLIWVVDSSDVRRLADCRAELHNLLKEEVQCWQFSFTLVAFDGYEVISKWCDVHWLTVHCQQPLPSLVLWGVWSWLQRLAGASLLVFANKQDIQGALKPAEIAKVVVLLVVFLKFIFYIYLYASRIYNRSNEPPLAKIL